MIEKDESSKVNVVEYYRDYSPPVDVVEPVRELLRYIPDKYLENLYGVTLTNSQSTRLLRRGKTWTQQRKVKLADCRGLYSEGQVTLLVDRIFLNHPPFLLRLNFFRTGLIGEVLYHEIGHHIHYTALRDRRDKEFAADHWGAKLLRRFMSKRYWYLWILLAPYRLIIRPVVRLFRK